jgi:hypothetical protein
MLADIHMLFYSQGCLTFTGLWQETTGTSCEVLRVTDFGSLASWTVCTRSHGLVPSCGWQGMIAAALAAVTVNARAGEGSAVKLPRLFCMHKVGLTSTRFCTRELVAFCYS